MTFIYHYVMFTIIADMLRAALTFAALHAHHA